MALWQPVALQLLMHYNDFGNMMDSYDEHKGILDAIRAGDKFAALAALAANIQQQEIRIRIGADQTEPDSSIL